MIYTFPQRKKSQIQKNLQVAKNRQDLVASQVRDGVPENRNIVQSRNTSHLRVEVDREKRQKERKRAQRLGVRQRDKN